MKRLIRIFNFECYWWGERFDLNLNFAFALQILLLMLAAWAGANSFWEDGLGFIKLVSINHAAYIYAALYIYVILLTLSWVGSRRFYVGLAQTPLLLLKVLTLYLLGFFLSYIIVVPLLILIVVLLIIDGVKAIIRASRRSGEAPVPAFPVNPPHPTDSANA